MSDPSLDIISEIGGASYHGYCTVNIEYNSTDIICYLNLLLTKIIKNKFRNKT